MGVTSQSGSRKMVQELPFDIVIETKQGLIFAMYLHHDMSELARVHVDNSMKLSVQKAHDLLGLASGWKNMTC
jgi:hypothetical protein